MPAISLTKVWHFRMVRCGVLGSRHVAFQMEYREDKRKEKQCSSFPGSLILKYLKNDITNIQHRRGDVKCFANYFQL